MDHPKSRPSAAEVIWKGDDIGSFLGLKFAISTDFATGGVVFSAGLFKRPASVGAAFEVGSPWSTLAYEIYAICVPFPSLLLLTHGP